MNNQVSIIQIDYPNKKRDAVMVHINVANNLLLHQKYTTDRMCGYVLEEDFNKNYKIIKEDERQTNNDPEGVVPDNSGGSTNENNNVSGNGNEVRSEPQRKRSPRKPKG